MLFSFHNTSFLIGGPATGNAAAIGTFVIGVSGIGVTAIAAGEGAPVVRRDTIRAPVPPVTASGTTVVMFVPPDKPEFGVPVDPKPWKVRA